MIKLALPAAFVSLLAIAPAAAAPATSAPGFAQQPASGLVQVQGRPDDARGAEGGRRGDSDRGHRRHQYKPGSRHAHGPHGWHRHHSRPRDWHTRGCVVAGPIWFCP